MSPNQHFRLLLLRSVYLEGPQPIELEFFQSKFSDIDSARWLSTNGLYHYYEDQDVSIYRQEGRFLWATPKRLRFIWIAAKEEETIL